MTTITAPEPTILTPAERAEAGRQAMKDCPYTFEELRGDGDSDLVEHAASSDANILAALDALGELSEEEAPYLGKFLAEQLVQDAIEAEASKQFAAYRARTPETSSADLELAYEPNDPKHPGYLDRLGV